MKVFLDKNRIKEEYFNNIKSNFKNVEFISNVEDSYDCEVIFVEPNYVTEANIKKYSNLKWIQSYRAGYDTVDFNFLNKKGIKFSNAKDIYSIAIAEDVILKILMLNRNVRKYLKDMENKAWKPYFGEPELYKSTVGIIGMGSIAKEIAKRIKAFDVEVLGYRKNYRAEEYFDQVLVGKDGLNKILSSSDYLILTTPLNDETKFMINKEAFAIMKNSAVLVNIARGEVVDQEALIEALQTKTIRAAALDVMYPEPLPKDSKLWDLDNVYITPHSSASSPHINFRLSQLFIENLKRYLEGKEVLHRVN